MNRSGVGRAWRIPRNLVIGLAALVALNWVFNAVVVGFPENPATVEQVEADLGAALPIGAVLDWARKRRGADFSVMDHGDPIFGVTIRDTGRSFLISEDIRVDFAFGADDRLIDRNVGRWLTGP